MGCFASGGWRRMLGLGLGLAVGLVAGPGRAADAGVAGKKLVLIDRLASRGTAKLEYVASDAEIQKGADGDPGLLDARLEVFYGDIPGAGGSRLDMPRGAGWVRNDGSARYVNRSAPSEGAVRSAVIQPGRRARIVARALGDTPEHSIDLFTPGTSVTTVLTVFNRVDGSLHRMCTRFGIGNGSSVVVKEIDGGAGRKLIATNGVSVPCTLNYSGEMFWLCKPGMTENQCFVNGLDSTKILTDNSTEVELHQGSEEQPYDCFYVYPTVDLTGPVGNHTDFSDISLELDPLLSQAARLNDSCRIFAPLYRQITFSTFGSTDIAKFSEIAFRDVKAAWDDYLEQHNQGRNVVILGHSQGTGMTSRLMQEEVDPSPELRQRLIVALLIGGGITVPQGQTVGGTFQNIPLCTSDAQTRCVIAYRSYAEGFPPEDGSNVVGPPGMDTACTNPAALGGGEGLFSGTYFPAVSNQPLFQLVPDPGFGTPFTKYEDFYAGECVKDADNRSYLEIRVRPGPGDLRENQVPFNHLVLAPGFLGTHILDYNFALGDLIELVELKAAAMP